MPHRPSRRDTLKTLSALAGVAATGSTLSGCEAPPDDGPADDTDLADPRTAIETIVVLMMENRSFDHVFGSLTLAEGREDVNGLTADMANPDADGEPVPVFRLTKECQLDPPHGWSSSHRQFADGACSGFVLEHQGGATSVSREAMGYYLREDLPIVYTLSDDNALCDAWFASVMGPTWPNRFYSFCATAEGMTHNDRGAIPFGAPSLFDQLDEAGVAWKVYFHDAPFSVLLERTGGLFGDNLRPIDEFFLDAAAGRLPPVVFIEPGYTINDDHPPHPVLLGQALIGTIYQTLADSPHWDRSMMVLNYDEHGGFFDHVAPPTTPDDHATDGFDQLGFRVPAMVMGPYARASVVHTTYDHTSVLKHIQEMFGLEPLTQRNAHASALWDCLDTDRMARRDPRPPTVIPTLDVSPEDYGDGCIYGVAPGQEELDEAFDLGLVDGRYDRRHLAADTLDRMLVRAEKLGVLRFTGR